MQLYKYLQIIFIEKLDIKLHIFKCYESILTIMQLYNYQLLDIFMRFSRGVYSYFQAKLSRSVEKSLFYSLFCFMSPTQHYHKLSIQ